MKHTSKSPHVQKLMGGHHNNSGPSPADILMRGQNSHHFAGGMAAPSSHYKKGGEPKKACHGGRFAKGGTVGHHRKHHDDGGPTNLNDTMSMQTPASGEKPLTGSLKRGGSAHGHHRKREHHFWGALAGAVLPEILKWGAGKLFGGEHEAHGGKISPLKRAMGGAAKVRKGMMTETGGIR